MLIAEYDYATDIAVQRAEERKIAYTEGKSLGLAEGKSLGFAEGEARGRSEGSHQKALETARLMRQRAYPVAEICLMTGLTTDEVEAIHNS